MHSIECKFECMSSINQDILKFHELSGLSEHRVGILLAGNGMLVPRAKNGGRHYRETELTIKSNLTREVSRRSLDASEFQNLLVENQQPNADASEPEAKKGAA